MEQYSVSGMSCAACSARVEKAVQGVKGVTAVSVSLLTNSMGVEGGNEADIIDAVKKAGYSAVKKGSDENSSAAEYDSLTDNQTPLLLKRLIFSLLFLILLMYLSMGHVMWGFPLPKALADNHLTLGILQMLLSAVVMGINYKFFTNGFKGLIHRSPNMDTLVSLGSGVSFFIQRIRFNCGEGALFARVVF